MADRDIKSSLLLFIVGCGICIYAITTRLGTLNRPGPGFFAFLTGIAISLLSMIIFLRAIWNPAPADTKGKYTYRWRNVLLTALTIIGYSFGLETLGYLVTTLIFTILLFRIIQPQEWWIVILGGTATTFVSYLLFHVWLKVELPIGFWGF